ERDGGVGDQVRLHLEREGDRIGAHAHGRRVRDAGPLDHTLRRALDEVGDPGQLGDRAGGDLAGPPRAHRAGADDDRPGGAVRGQGRESGPLGGGGGGGGGVGSGGPAGRGAVGGEIR